MNKLTVFAAALTFAAGLHAQDDGYEIIDDTYRLAPSDSGSLSYTGDDGRVGLGINNDGDFLGEVLWAFGSTDARTWIGEGWVDDEGAGGLKVNFHWLAGEIGKPDRYINPEDVRVYKLFFAADQNQWDDRKLTAGGGVEKNDLFFEAYVSGAISGERRVSRDTTVLSDFIEGVQEGRPFRQALDVTTITEVYEHPYEWGLGARLGKYFDEPLLRVRGGLDYEDGDFGANQWTVSLGAEKFFEGTGHSLALNAERIEKNGNFEIDTSDTRATLIYRYNFGENYERTKAFIERRQQVQQDVSAADEAAIRPIMNRVTVDEQAFFEFDRSRLVGQAREDLSRLIARIKDANPVDGITVTGHTCNIGTVDYNQGLSERRAASVKTFLVDGGIAADTIETRGEGELQPRHSNDTEESRQRNRRVDIEFVTLEAGIVERTVEAQPDQYEWVREPIEDPAWIKRALLNPVQHKRSVDVYREVRTTTTEARGPIEFLNRGPAASDDAATVSPGSTNNAIDVLANDSDPDGDVLTIISVTQPANGTVTSTSDGVSYTPNDLFVGTDTFTYTISDGTEQAQATVTITVNMAAAPSLANDMVDTPFETPITVNVLANDSDPQGSALTVTRFSGSMGEFTAEIVGDDSIRVTPAMGFSGKIMITYTAVNEFGVEGTAVLTVDVGENPDGGAPIANDDTATTTQETPVLIDVLANDSDPEGEALTIVSVGNTMDGSVSVSGAQISFTPAAGFVGTTSFDYTIEDTDGLQATATVTVTVTATGGGLEAPIAVDDAASTDIDTPVTIDVLANDSDPDGGNLRIVAVSGDASNVEIVGNQIVFTPDAGFTGVTTFGYTIADDDDLQDSATVTVTVGNVGPNNAPTANNDFFQLPKDVPSVIDVLANDTDPDGDPLTIIRVTPETTPFATITISEDGTRLTYNPNDDWFGNDVFTYAISDGRGGQSMAIVEVQVQR